MENKIRGIPHEIKHNGTSTVGHFVVIKTKNQVGKIWGKWQPYFPLQKTKSPTSHFEKQGFR